MTRSEVWLRAYVAAMVDPERFLRCLDLPAKRADQVVEEYGKRFKFSPAGDDGRTPTIPDLG